MPNTYLDKAIEAVPKFEERISLFTKKLRLAQYADSTIYSYRLKISQAVLYLKKLPDNFTQADVDDYLTMLLDRNCYSLSFFKHTVFGMKDYYKYMGLKEPGGLIRNEGLLQVHGTQGAWRTRPPQSAQAQEASACAVSGADETSHLSL